MDTNLEAAPSFEAGPAARLLRQPISAERHFAHLSRLLALEAQAEEAQLRAEIQRTGGPGGNAEQSGYTLRGLVIQDEGAGMGGRALLTLRKRNQLQALPWHRLTPGSPVLLSEDAQNGASWRGVISQVGRENIQVALEHLPDSESDRPTYRLDLASDEVARQRARQAMQQAERARRGRLAELRDVLLGVQPPLREPLEPLVAFDTALDESQRAAVSFSLASPDVAIIHGPPGTGKTTTVVELIRQCVRRGEQVLACAPSNLAVDNLFERLLDAGVRAIRLGHPARVLPELRQHTLDELIEHHPDVVLARRLQREANELRKRAERWIRGRPNFPGEFSEEKRQLRERAAQLNEEARALEASAVDRLLSGAEVICATLTGLNDHILGGRIFPRCVVDEASQSIEPMLWPAICRAKQLTLAGDHQQLPPTVISLEAAAQGLSVSLMERLMTDHNIAQPDSVARRLTVQYRMHEHIMGFSNEMFYDGDLRAHSSVAGHRLSDLPGVQLPADSPLAETALLFLDTAGAGYEEEVESGGESRLNPQEAGLAVQIAKQLLQSGLRPEQIGVITPYSAQVRLLQAQMPDGIDTSSVDGFQGREKEAIIISLVRSNFSSDIGFLADVRRMNVAMTRARRCLVIIGDSATIAAHPFYQRLLDYLDRVGGYQSVWTWQQ